MCFDADTLSWTCHVCGDERPDAYIGVMSRWAYRLPNRMSLVLPQNRIYFKQNVRYCRDRGECMAEAANKEFFRGIIFVRESEIPARWKGQS